MCTRRMSNSRAPQPRCPTKWQSLPAGPSGYLGAARHTRYGCYRQQAVRVCVCVRVSFCVRLCVFISMFVRTYVCPNGNRSHSLRLLGHGATNPAHWLSGWQSRLIGSAAGRVGSRAAACHPFRMWTALPTKPAVHLCTKRGSIGVVSLSNTRAR